MERFARTISWKCLSKAKRCSLLFRYKQPLVCMSLEEAMSPRSVVTCCKSCSSCFLCVHVESLHFREEPLIFILHPLLSYYILFSPIIYNIGGKQRWPMTPWERCGQCFYQTIGQAQKRALKERENTTLPKPASYRYEPTEGRYSLRSVASRSKARSSLASMISRSPGPLSLMPQRWRMPWMITRWSSSS